MVDGPAGEHQDAETGRAADRLLTGSQDHIQVPLVKGNLLASDTANPINNHQGVGANPANNFRDALDVAQHAGGGINVGNSDYLVGLFLQCLLDLLKGRTVANRCLELCRVSAVCLQAGSKGIGKVSGVQDERIFALLDQVRSHNIPAECATAGDDEGLCGGLGGLEEFPNQGQGLSKNLNEGGADMAFTGSIVGTVLVGG